MKQGKLEQMSVSQLVDRFAVICADQDRALLYSELSKYDQLYREMRTLEDQLKSRTGDQRRALLVLYDHPNAQVRLQAAGATLAVAPEAARSLLETIASSRKYPQAGDAGMIIDGLDRGDFTPT